MHDPTEATRRAMIAEGAPHRHLAAADRAWTSDELARDFTVHSFLAPFVFVTRKADDVKGVMEFTHSPRLYFAFTPD